MNQPTDPERSSDAGILTFDERDRITSFSRGMEKILGWQKEFALWQPLDSVFRLPGRVTSFRANLPPAGQQKQIDVIHRNGETVNIMVACVHPSNSKGDECDTVLVMRDLTTEQAAQNVRSYFLGSISHDFRTPLAALNASVELLLEDLEELSREEIAQLLNSVHFSVAGLQTMIDNLLESTNIEAGQFRLRLRKTDLHQVADEALHVMRPLLNRRQQTLQRYIPRQLPIVKIDTTRLTQVLVNLISNASKYSSIGETIELALRIDNNQNLYVTVSDRGPGIPPDRRDEIFRRYVRLGNKDEAQYGVGLGLSVVKAIVEQHGGQIAVEDRPGGGSIFWFTIPVEKYEGGA